MSDILREVFGVFNQLWRNLGDGVYALVQVARLERRKVVETVTIANGGTYSGWIDMRHWAAISISFPDAMTGSHFQIVGRMEEGDEEEKAVYDDSDSLLVQPIRNAIVCATVEPYYVPWIAIKSCSDANGTPETEGAARTIKVCKSS